MVSLVYHPLTASSIEKALPRNFNIFWILKILHQNFQEIMKQMDTTYQVMCVEGSNLIQHSIVLSGGEIVNIYIYWDIK